MIIPRPVHSLASLARHTTALRTRTHRLVFPRSRRARSTRAGTSPSLAVHRAIHSSILPRIQFAEQMAKKNERTKGNSGKRASNQKASSLAVNTSKRMDRTGVVAGCVPRKNRRPRARHPPASPASPEKIKSPEKSPGRPRPRVSSPLSNKRKKVSRAQREKRPSQVTATPPAGLKKSGLKRPTRHPTAKTGLKPVSTVPSSSPTKRNRGRNNNKRARLPPRRATAKNTDKLTTVTNGAVTKKKPRRVRFKNVPGAPINSTRKIIHRYNNRKNKVKPASSLASPCLSRHGGGVVLERLLKGQIDTYGTHLRRSARLTPSRCGSPAPSMMFSPMRGDSTPGREEWYADNLPEDVFTTGERESAGVREYDEWVDGVVETPVPRPEYLTSPRVQWTPRSPAPHR